MGKKKILFMSYGFYPWRMPAARKWTNVTREWIKRGHEVYVISAWMAGSKEYEEWNGIKIFRAKNIFENIRAGISNGVFAPGAQSKKRSIGIIKMIYKKILRLIWPDVSVFWAIYSMGILRKIMERHSFDYCVSMSLPFTSHLLGFWAKRKDEKMKWIADIQDPFYLQNPDPPNLKLFGPLNAFLEKFILRNVDYVTVTNHEIEKLYSINFKIKKISTVSHLVSDEIRYVKKNKKAKGFVFVGTLHPVVRNPSFALKTIKRYLEKVKNEEFHFYGNLSSCLSEFNKYEHFLNRNIFLHDYVPEGQLMELYSKYRYLMNIGNVSKYQLPSKIIDYMASGMPIIHFSRIENDPCARILDRCGYALEIKACGDIQENITKMIEFVKNIKGPSKEQVKKIMKKYETKNITDLFDAAFEAIGEKER